MSEKIRIQAHVNNYLSKWSTCTTESHDLITILQKATYYFFLNLFLEKKCLIFLRQSGIPGTVSSSFFVYLTPLSPLSDKIDAWFHDMVEK